MVRFTLGLQVHQKKFSIGHGASIDYPRSGSVERIANVRSIHYPFPGYKLEFRDLIAAWNHQRMA